MKLIRTMHTQAQHMGKYLMTREEVSLKLDIADAWLKYVNIMLHTNSVSPAGLQLHYTGRTECTPTKDVSHDRIRKF